MFTQQIQAAFRPNQPVSARTLLGLGVAQGALLLVLWAHQPFAVLPGPLQVAQAWAELWREQGLGAELAASAATSLEAVGLTTALSLGLAYLTILPAARPLVGLLSKGRFLGLMGLTLVFTLAVGGGHALKLVLLVFGMTVFFVTGMAAEVAAIPPERFDHARSLRMGDARIVWEVVVRGTADRAFEVLRQNAAIGWTLLTLVEGLVRSEGGVGTLLLNQNKHFHLAEVFAIQLSILAVGMLQDALLAGLRRAVCPYAVLARERS